MYWTFLGLGTGSMLLGSSLIRMFSTWYHFTTLVFPNNIALSIFMRLALSFLLAVVELLPSNVPSFVVVLTFVLSGVTSAGVVFSSLVVMLLGTGVGNVVL